MRIRITEIDELVGTIEHVGSGKLKATGKEQELLKLAEHHARVYGVSGDALLKCMTDRLRGRLTAVEDGGTPGGRG